MSLLKLSKYSLILAITAILLTSCLPNILDNGSYEMPIQEISNPRILDLVTSVDVTVINRGCAPQVLVGADVDRTGNTIKVAINYKDEEGVATCATFEEVHTVNLGTLSSGTYLVQAKGQEQPSLTIEVP